MYFSRLRLNPAVEHRRLAQTLCQDNYREHQLLWQLFADDPDAARDFLYRQVIDNGQIKYYLLSRRPPQDRDGLWLIDPPKAYAPQLSVGQRLQFSLRANPVVTAKNNGKKQRHDVVMHEKTRIGYKNLAPEQRPPLQHLIRESCLHWLQNRADTHGFQLPPDPEHTQIEAYQQHHSRSRQGRRPIRYSSVDYQGVLTVTDPERLGNALYHGIGKAKAFGCGLLLIRRIP